MESQHSCLNEHSGDGHSLTFSFSGYPSILNYCRANCFVCGCGWCGWIALEDLPDEMKGWDK